MPRAIRGRESARAIGVLWLLDSRGDKEGDFAMMLPMEAIRAESTIQAREEIDAVAVREYADAMKEGIKFPAIVVFSDGENSWLADGYHRLAAAKEVGWTKIDSDIRTGTRRDALLFAASANSAHGLRRTNADKRRAVTLLLQDEEWRHWSNREIARRCAVSEFLVRQVRESICDKIADESQIARSGTQPSEAAHANEQDLRIPFSDLLPDVDLDRMPSPLKLYVEAKALTEVHVQQLARLQHIYGPDLCRPFNENRPKNLIKVPSDAAALLVVIRPEGRLIYFAENPLAVVFEGVRAFDGYVSDRGGEVRQWEIAACWWASLSVQFAVSVGQLGRSLTYWSERYFDALLWWHLFGGFDRECEDHELLWGFYHDLKHSGSLERAKKLDQESELYLKLLKRLDSLGSYVVPSELHEPRAPLASETA
jgi:hypothetical protein